jgi:hypothetical protein
MNRKEIEKELETLYERLNERHEWLMNNIDSPNWREVKRDFNAIRLKIDNRLERLENYGSVSSQPDYNQIGKTPNIVR